MNFAKVSNSYGSLRARLALLVGEQALPSISVEAPERADDQSSFSRLVSWCYIAIFETGRTSLGYLRQLPPWKAPASSLLPYVRPLRTSLSHNLALDKEADQKTLRQSMEWFLATCGAGTPNTPTHWKSCFDKLCIDMEMVLQNALSACDGLSSPVDGPRLIEGLKERLDKNWEAYRFDPFAADVLNSLGYGGIDVVAFRGLHLDAWRKVVASSEEDHIRLNLRIRIEADALAHMNRALPFSAEELGKLTNITDRQTLVALLIALRDLPPEHRNSTLRVIAGS